MRWIPKGLIFLCLILGTSFVVWASGGASSDAPPFPLPLDGYGDAELEGTWAILVHRASHTPFNLVATLLFFCAIVHTFLTSKFIALAHRLDHAHQAQRKLAEKKGTFLHDTHFGAEVLHFLGEVEVVFGLWVIPLIIVILGFYDWSTVVHYISGTVNYTEPMFVFVIMALAATRPIIKLAEGILQQLAKLGGSSPAAWWLTLLTVTPLLGSFITEPAAMTISALLLGKQFYDLKPSKTFAYATLGLLFVNISVGGTLSHFAAPPVLMVVAKWNWDFSFMFFNFGWKSVLGIVIANAVYYVIFRKEFGNLKKPRPIEQGDPAMEVVPLWITGVHIAFLAWTVVNVHHPEMFVGGFLIFLGFAQATAPHQYKPELKSALLVGYFLAGLVTHGGLQGWWIAPVLSNLDEVPLMLGSTVLTAFNDNASITFLSTLVPNFSDSMKYAVVAGAVTGGGLTVIANAPNPAGQSILSKYFEEGVSMVNLALGALIPTIILGFTYMLLR